MKEEDRAQDVSVFLFLSLFSQNPQKIVPKNKVSLDFPSAEWTG